MELFITVVFVILAVRLALWIFAPVLPIIWGVFAYYCINFAYSQEWKNTPVGNNMRWLGGILLVIALFSAHKHWSRSQRD